DVHGPADQHPEPEQPDAARAPQLSAGRGAAPRRMSPRAGGTRARRLPPDADEILQALTTAVVVLAPDLSITYMNPSAESLLGVSLRQAEGRPLADVVHPADELETLCRRALDSGLTFSLRELEAKAGDRELIVDCRAQPLDAEPGLLLELFDT